MLNLYSTCCRYVLKYEELHDLYGDNLFYVMFTQKSKTGLLFKALVLKSKSLILLFMFCVVL